MLPLFAELVSETDEARREFETHPALLDAVANGLSVERYQRLLLELYHVVWHFNPVCAAAASRLDDRFRDVRYFLYEHMHEESGHEIWVLNDLAAIGVDASTAIAHSPSVYTQTLNGYNYWATERLHPCAALGMLYTLEVIASVYGGPFASAVKESLMLDGEQGISFIGSHATLDQQHMADLRKVLNLVTDADAARAIKAVALVNFHHFTRIIEAV